MPPTSLLHTPRGDIAASTDPESSLAVHLLAGLPTEAVRGGFERAGDVMLLVPMDALAQANVGEAHRIGVVLPPFVEPSVIVESWEDCDFLASRFGRPAHVAGVSTFVDVEHVRDHLASAASLSSRGWGRSRLDRRSIADIAVEQIESATHLALVGAGSASESLARCLTVLNPSAPRVHWTDGAKLDRTRLAAALGLREPGADSARVVPPWLDVLRGDLDPTLDPDVFVYRRARPFDPTRLGLWLENPPTELLRGKGHVWLANAPDQSFGYSCAGSVHRLFPAGRWWASQAEGTWPTCPRQRMQLLERWHPRFGDRRQELVLVGMDLDPDRLRADLDGCLVADEEIDRTFPSPRSSEALSTGGARLH